MTDKALISIAIIFVAYFLLYHLFGMLGVVAASAVVVVSTFVDNVE